PSAQQSGAAKQSHEVESTDESISEGVEEQVAKDVVDLTSVSKEYLASGQRVKALETITLAVKEREFVAIIGPSGAGKTTLLNLIAGLETPSEGDIRVLGIDLVDSEENFLSSFRSANIGFIFQSYNLVSTLTAAENVELMMELAGWSDAARNEKLTTELIDIVGLAERAQHLPSQLSGGEQQRVAIARALVNDTPIILADEPTGNLHSNTGLEIVRLIASLREERHETVIITTHDDWAV